MKAPYADTTIAEAIMAVGGIPVRDTDYANLEDAERRRVETLDLADKLLIIAANNTVSTLAAFRAAVLSGRPAAVVERTLAERLGATPVAAGCDGLFAVNVAGLAGQRLVCFTSGSSGTPKGILRRYESWRRTFKVQRDTLQYRPHTRVLVLGNLAHSLHLYGAMEALDRGVVPAVLDRFSPKQALEACCAEGLKIIYATPAHLNLILAYAENKPVAPLDGVSLILAGGAKLDERRLGALRALFPRARVVEFFGTTETSYITMKSPDAPSGSVGRALPGVTLKVTDADGRPRPPGQEGLLWINSEMLFERYLFGEDANTRWRGGFVTVGDQGYLDAAGHLFFTARMGSMVTIAGENVFLDHVENRLRARVPAGEAAVLALDDPLRGCRLVAVTQNAMTDGAAGAVLRSLREDFGPLKAPKAVIHVPDWPFLPSGKTDRRRLLARLANRR